MIANPLKYFLIALLVFAAELCLSIIYPSLQLRLLLGIVAVHFAWRAGAERVGSSSPIGLYVLISAIYVFAALVEIAYFGNRANLDPLLMGTLTDMGVAFLLCVVGGYLLVERPSSFRPGMPRVGASQVIVSVWTCIGLFAACIVLTVVTLGFSIGNLSRTEIYSQNLGFLGVIRGLLSIGLAISAALLAAYERRTGRDFRIARLQLFGTMAAYVLQDLLIFGDRRLPLMALLATGALFMRTRFTWRQITMSTGAAVVLFAYGFVRNTPPSTWLGTLLSGDILYVISPTSTEFGGLAIIGQSLGGFSGKIWNFPTYFDAVLQVVPRSILPDRPLAPTEWFMDTFYPALSAAGASYAFNQVIEARLNAGILGIPVAGVLTGAAISYLGRLRYLDAPVGVALAVYIFTFSMRMDLASILRTAIIAAIGSGLVLTIAAVARVPDQPHRVRTRPL